VSQLEQRVRAVLGPHPEIEKCVRLGLVNRRALARHLVRQGVAEAGQIEAVVATLRRMDLGAESAGAARVFPEVRIGLKDRILILDFEKERALLQRLERLIPLIDYDRGDTLKIVVGTESLKLIIDQRREKAVRGLFERFRVRHRLEGISEISMMFPTTAVDTPGILAVLGREFLVRDVTVAELLTASPEMLIYLQDPYVPRAYEAVRGLQGLSL